MKAGLLGVGPQVRPGYSKPFVRLWAGLGADISGWRQPSIPLPDPDRQTAVDQGAGSGRVRLPMHTLTKAELIEEVAAVTGLLKKDAESIVDEVIASMIDSLQAGSPIEIRGFGSFRFRERAARTGRNPKTGAAVKVPAKRICYFKPGSIFLDFVNS